MKKKSTIALAAAGMSTLALITALVQADASRNNVLDLASVDMEAAITIATNAKEGRVLEAELEAEKGTPVWEIELVNENSRVTTIEINGRTGEILSSHSDDEAEQIAMHSVSISEAIAVVQSVEGGQLIEAEIERERDSVIWEIEAVTTDRKNRQYRIDGETGEILL